MRFFTETNGYFLLALSSFNSNIFIDKDIALTQKGFILNVFSIHLWLCWKFIPFVLHQVMERSVMLTIYIGG